MSSRPAIPVDESAVPVTASRGGCTSVMNPPLGSHAKIGFPSVVVSARAGRSVRSIRGGESSRQPQNTPSGRSFSEIPRAPRPAAVLDSGARVPVMWIAVTRPVSPSLARCELTHLPRQPIDVDRATAQHAAYEDLLRDLGATIVRVPGVP